MIPTWPYLDTHGPLARHVADAALLLAAIAGADASDPLALQDARSANQLTALRADALAGVRLGLVEAHVPRAQMSPEALVVWDRAIADLSAAGAIIELFTPPVTRTNYRDAFANAAKLRNDVAPNSRAPVATANALYRYFAGRRANPRAAGMQAMIYPTMPFNAFRVADGWPETGSPLGYGNWLGLPEVSVPAGFGANGLPALNLSVVGLPGEDARVLVLAHSYERQSHRFRRPRRPT